MRQIFRGFLMAYLGTMVFYLLSGVLLLLLWPFILLPRPIGARVCRIYLKCQKFFLQLFCGITYRVEGHEHLPGHPVVIASQHESTWETLYYHDIFDFPVMYAKKEIFHYPFFGRLTRYLDHIPVDRSGPSDAVRDMFRRGADAVKSGRNLLIFPSGTRRNSTHSPLHSGIGVLYQLSGAEVVPVLVNSGRCWPAGQFAMRPGVITVRILAPIPAGLNRRDMMSRLDTALAARIDPENP